MTWICRPSRLASHVRTRGSPIRAALPEDRTLSSENPYLHEQIENWVGDFCQSDALGDALPDADTELKAHAPRALTGFLRAACARAGCSPAELEQKDVSAAFLEALAAQQLPSAVHASAPDLVAAFLGHLEGEGRLGGGRAMGMYLKAMRGQYAERASGTTKPIKNRASKLGRNDPCPCGSGKKYKKCCRKLA